jgi:hypothetical protein
MSIITIIDNIPLFNDSYSALTWGELFGLRSFHTHVFQGQIGYMAGSDHASAKRAVKSGIVTPPVITTPTTPTPEPPTTITTTPPPTTTTDGGY